MNSWNYDGGADIRNALELSGEPMVSQISGMYGRKREEASASDISKNNIAKREYQKDYMEYWNDTTRSTSTGRPVDAIIGPLAPFAAARPGRYKYYGCTSFQTQDFPSKIFDRKSVSSKLVRRSI